MRWRQRLIFIIPFVCLWILACADAQAQLATIPQPQGYVNDFAGLLDPSDRQTIQRYAAELEKKTTAQIAVVTVQSTQPETIQRYSVRLFDQWKIGQQGKDNGVLLLVAVSDRKAWITTGYGLEGAIPDLVANRIVTQTMIPLFKQDQYSRGITKGAVAIISLIAKENQTTITGQETRVYQQVRKKKSLWEVLFMIIFFLLIFSSRTGLLGYFFLGALAPGGRRRHGYWYGSGLGGSSGGFSGGFGGFGGGMTGGGGGGGGW
jgi:uncharacterized protein